MLFMEKVVVTSGAKFEKNFSVNVQKKTQLSFELATSKYRGIVGFLFYIDYAYDHR